MEQGRGPESRQHEVFAGRVAGVVPDQGAVVWRLQAAAFEVGVFVAGVPLDPVLRPPVVPGRQKGNSCIMSDRGVSSSELSREFDP